MAQAEPDGEADIASPTSPTRPTLGQHVRRTSSLGDLGSPWRKRADLKRSISVPNEPLSADVIRGLRRWVLCFALVKFDLNEGPDLDNVYPSTTLSRKERTNIAFASFPDAARTGSLAFSWRIPRTGGSREKKAGPSTADLHGFVYFVQRRDDSQKRGYTQQSLVLISPLPDFPGLLSSLLSEVGPLYTANGSAVLETCVHNIARWPAPSAGTRPELPFVGQVRRFSLPLLNQVQLAQDPPPFKGRDTSSTPASHPSSSLSELLFAGPRPLPVGSLWVLWEILLLCEPLLVFTTSPCAASELVWHLRALIKPIPFSADWRPYLTIHDPDFALLTNPTNVPAGALVGATNPIILTACRHWPHVLNVSGVHGEPGLSTARRRHVKKDQVFDQDVEALVKQRKFVDADARIRRHFAMLTEQFLQPLNRYFALLLPIDASSLSLPSRPGAFNGTAFLQSLKQYPPALEFRSKLPSAVSTAAAAFYSRWLRCPNWSSWLHQSIEAATAALRSRYLERLESGDVAGWASGKTEDEMMELISRLEEEMRLSESDGASPQLAHRRALSLDVATPESSPNQDSIASGQARAAGTRSEKLRAQANRLRDLRRASIVDSASDSDVSVGPSMKR